MSEWSYYLLAVLLLVVNTSGFAINFVALPGNLLIIAATAIFWGFVGTADLGVRGYTVGFLCALAVLGEGLEFVAGTVGAAKHRASRRALALSVVGSLVGSIAGATIGAPIPIVGSAIAALVGGAVGAAVGAVIGEDWKGRGVDTSLRVGAAAFWGRLMGTAAKILVGAVMLVVATVDSFW